jgi:DNA polymerase-3 subunit delta
VGKNLQKYRKLFDELKKGAIHQLYLLYGPEEYLKQEFVRELLQVAVPGTNRAFNLDVLYGGEFDKYLFDDRVNSFPMFTERRVVILRNFKDLSNADKDHVIVAASRLSQTVVLVVESPGEKLDTVRLKNLKKIADSRGLAFAFPHLDEQETLERVLGRFKREGIQIDPEALDLLVESVGTKLIDLINEVDKIFLAAEDNKTVDTDIVAAVVGRYRTETVFSLLDGIESESAAPLLEKLNLIIDGGEEPVFVLAMLLRRIVLLLEVKALVSELGPRSPSGQGLAAKMAGVTSPY